MKNRDVQSRVLRHPLPPAEVFGASNGWHPAAEFTSGEPGFGISTGQYMASRTVILTGGDTSANDAQPVGEEEGYVVPCHTEMQTRRGIWNIENLEFTQLLKDRAYEFLFVWAPLKMVGATSSPGNPIALY